MKSYTVYILRCNDNTFYTGITTDIEKRLHEHNTSLRGAKYTRYRRPVELMYHENCKDKSSALKREIMIKQLKKKQKEALWISG